MFKTLDTFFGPMVTIETDIRIAVEVQQLGQWEFASTLEILNIYQRHYAGRIGHMLDLGCNIGTWTLPLARRYPKNTVLAFDCQQPMVECVEQTIQLNCLTNVHAICCAVSDTSGTATRRVIDYGWGANFGAYEFEPPYANPDFNGQTLTVTDTITTKTIDSLALESVVFIKLDVEGMELKALIGAQETIQRCGPFVAFEHHKTDRKTAEQLLQDLGYSIHPQTIGQMTLAIPADL
jgi:FkbM family methyltransferase